MSKYIIGINMILMLLACRSQRTVVESVDRAPVIEDAVAAEAIFQNMHSFETMKVKRLDIGFNINGVTDNLKGNLAIARDSLIIISVVPMLGYEVLRIMCTKDSIIVINRTEKSYHASSIEYYLRKYNIGARFSDLQAVLTNEVFLYMYGFEDRKYNKEIRFENGRVLYLIESLLGGIKLTNQKITAENPGGQIKNILVEDYQRNVNLYVKYDDFQNQELETFPGSIYIVIRERNNSINLNIEYGQVVFDDQLNVKFEIPANYSRINL
jgi:hypothetical protein